MEEALGSEAKYRANRTLVVPTRNKAKPSLLLTVRFSLFCKAKQMGKWNIKENRSFVTVYLDHAYCNSQASDLKTTWLITLTSNRDRTEALSL